MLTIYELDQLGQWTGASRKIDPRDGWATTWALAPEPPELGDGQCAVWASGAWRLRVFIDPETVSVVVDDPSAELA